MRKPIRRTIARLLGIFKPAGDSIVREMEAHLEIATDEYIRRGMSPSAARRAAKIDAGSIDAATEAYRDQHGVPFLAAFRRDLGFASRGLRRHPRFGIGIAVSLALGIGLNTAIFTVVDDVLRRPLPYADPERLVAVGAVARGSSDETTEWLSYPRTAEAWLKARSVNGVALVAPLSRVVSGTAAPEYLAGAMATPTLLGVVGARPALGRWFTESETHERVVVISDATWRHQFGGDTAVVGRTLRLNGDAYTVIGVMPSGMGLPLGSAFWTPMTDLYGEVIMRLRDGQTPEMVDAELTMLSPMREAFARRKQTLDVIIEPLHDHLYGSAQPALLLLFGAAILLLLITCANVTNLSLARALERRRELAMRVALGASHGAVASLLLLENLLLTCLGGFAGLITAWMVTDSLVALAPPSVTLDGNIHLRSSQVVFVALLVVITCGLVSLAPLMTSMPHRLTASLVQSSVQGGRGRGFRRVRQSLVSAQLALTVLLLTGSGLLIRSVQRMTRPDHLGFSTDGVVVATISPVGDRYRLPGASAEFARRLEQKLREVPGVRLVASGPPPLVSGGGATGYREGFNTLFTWVDPARRPAPGSGPSPDGTMVWVKHVDSAYRAVFGLTISSGRWISAADDSSSTRVALLNRAAAKLFFGDVNPVGRILDVGPLKHGRPAPLVVGVVDDVLQRDITLTATAEVFLAAAQEPPIRTSELSVKSTASPAATIVAIRRALFELDPSLAAIRLESMHDIVEDSIARHRFVLRLLTLFASLGLLLAAIGLYGIVSYLVARRTPEIGIRLALGADRRHVLRLVMRESALLAVIGVTIGIPLALAGARLLSGFLYEVRTYDPLAFSSGPLILGLVAMAAAWMPARRAAAVDPALTLRVD
jgi:putative ABC transport system permease protein